jgi:acetolactate synthase-1/2/3 large subunit
MNGSEALLETLQACGIEVCFANPGTSEMQLVSAIGNSEGMRPVLCLFEGVVTGAADGYGRMADRPAVTLLHLGSGFSNGMANLHNARRAISPVVNIVGDHASYHLQYDAPLTSDLPGLTDWASSWARVAGSPDELSALGAEAVQASIKGNGAIATLVAPADTAWSPATLAAPALPAPALAKTADAQLERCAALLRGGKRTALFLGGRALRENNLQTLGNIAQLSGAQLLCQTFPTRLQRGAGRVPVARLPYFAEQATEVLAAFEQVIFVGADAPVSFFAYPGKASVLVADTAVTESLAGPHDDIDQAIAGLARCLPNATGSVALQERTVPDAPAGELTPQAVGQVMTRHLPANAVVSDEGATCGLAVYAETQAAEPHDWLTLTGGAIGQGLPLALGAAIACPEQKTVALQADGSAMYTIQALWSMAREDVDVTVVLLNNQSYAILNIELERVGAGMPTAKTLSMLDLSRPDMNFCELAEGLGVPASRVDSAEAFEAAFSAAMRERGPRMIEVML